MTRADLEQQLRAYEGTPEEAVHRERMLALLKEDGCFVRSHFPGHFTASALVVSHDGSRCLLHHHRFLDSWLQFGGHCDGDENLLRVALREAVEESGIEGLITTSQRPFDLDIHPIPENPKRGEPPHEHFDVRYVLIAPEGSRFEVSEESNALGWFTPSEARALGIDASLERLIAKWERLLERRGKKR